MLILNKTTARRYKRPEGIVSYLMASALTSNSLHLTATLVELAPSGEQRAHSHAPEQVYFILDGSGLMTVGDDAQEVRAGDCVFIPSGAQHGIRNSGTSTLRYFSAAAPGFEEDELRTLWPLPSEQEDADAQVR